MPSPTDASERTVIPGMRRNCRTTSGWFLSTWAARRRMVTAR